MLRVVTRPQTIYTQPTDVVLFSISTQKCYSIRLIIYDDLLESQSEVSFNLGKFSIDVVTKKVTEFDTLTF